ncbi:hypothetical protein BESB_017070 [Besnoitia besnoiti]|uniref:J domain-containing protein n=1 Tax=Besnoitia besnoiti TaxID=94643 RepID=A0A2A9M376_BESBE|nr:hypothetical protein BESB_017070 [Besnoitia besnoiti]PFH32389.1 hypothetical protein BESB_017070 [Besnoitia besnoiti]
MTDSREREASSFSGAPRAEDCPGAVGPTDRLYDLLQLSRDASRDTVKKAYRQLALLWHPDKGGSVQRFQALTAAFEVLGDDARRRAYDRSLIRTGSTDGLGVVFSAKSGSDVCRSSISPVRRRHSTGAGVSASVSSRSKLHQGTRRDEIPLRKSDFLSKEDFLERARGVARPPKEPGSCFLSGFGNVKNSAESGSRSGSNKIWHRSGSDSRCGPGSGENSGYGTKRDFLHVARTDSSATDCAEKCRRPSGHGLDSGCSLRARKDERTESSSLLRETAVHAHAGDQVLRGKPATSVTNALREVLGEATFTKAVAANVNHGAGSEAQCASHLVGHLSVKQLKQLLTILGIPHGVCFEKTDLLEAFTSALPLDSPVPSLFLEALKKQESLGVRMPSSISAKKCERETGAADETESEALKAPLSTADHSHENKGLCISKAERGSSSLAANAAPGQVRLFAEKCDSDHGDPAAPAMGEPESANPKCRNFSNAGFFKADCGTNAESRDKRETTAATEFTTAWSSSFGSLNSSAGSSKTGNFTNANQHGGILEGSVGSQALKNTRKPLGVLGPTLSLLGAAVASSWAREEKWSKLNREGEFVLSAPLDKANSADMVHLRGDALRMKILALGAEKTGKSCLIKRYCEGRFVVRNASTIGIDYGVKVIELEGGTQARVNFFDFSGRREFAEIRQSFYDNTDGIMLVFDASRRETFEELPAWIAEAKEHGVNIETSTEGEATRDASTGAYSHEKYNETPAEACVPVVLLANKIDIGDRQVSAAEIAAFAKSRGILFFETSANSDHNVSTALETLFSVVTRRITELRKKIISPFSASDALTVPPVSM